MQRRQRSILNSGRQIRLYILNIVVLCLTGAALNNTNVNLDFLISCVPPKARYRGVPPHPNPQPWNHDILLPLPIILHNFVKRGLPEDNSEVPVAVDDLWTFVEDSLDELSPCVEMLKVEFDEQGGFIIFDGLDEVPVARRKQVTQVIEGFAKEYINSRVLVTCRTNVYQQKEWKLSGFDEAILAPLT